MGSEAVQDTNEVLTVRRDWPRSEKEWDSRLVSILSTMLEAPLVHSVRQECTYRVVQSGTYRDVDHDGARNNPHWSFEDQIACFAYGLGEFTAIGNERKNLQKWDRGQYFSSDKAAYQWLMENCTLHPSLTKLAWLVQTGDLTHD